MSEAAPDDLAAFARRHDGIELFRRMIDDTLPGPPIAELLNFHVAEAEPGCVVFRGTPKRAFYNPLGSVHGGWAATIMDSALACAVHTTCKAGEAYTTVEFKVNLTRPIFEETGECACEGRIVHRGSRIATSEARLTDASGKLLADGTQTCLIMAV